ncbi:hypothetical protein SAMN05216369_3218 [Marinobacter antarcticus]|uniref:Uncharacterized protein n=1 Tax=Marinobacter antarcticus TaxID=564117 RepID=A0A1M6VII3_9GAMM|nr:hypothetical protein SAMN05216369_3218 [Marinobacter antarcticus]
MVTDSRLVQLEPERLDKRLHPLVKYFDREITEFSYRCFVCSSPEAYALKSGAAVRADGRAASA